MRTFLERLAIYLTLGIVSLTNVAHALNPIHESTYLAYGGGLSQGMPTLHAAFIVPSGGDVIDIPIGQSLALGPRFEIGGGLKTQWGGADDLIPAIVFGGQIAVSSRSALGLHFLMSTHGGDYNGLTGVWHTRGGLGRKVSTDFDFRLGFLDALVDGNALCAMELSYGLKLHVTRGVSLLGGLVASSQTKSFNDHFALDVEPGVHVGTGRNSGVQTVVTLGLAGERRETMRVKVGWVQAF